MDIRKYFHSAGSRAAKNTSVSVNKTESLNNSKERSNILQSQLITEKNDDNNNNKEKLEKKEPKLNKSIPKLNDTRHEESSSEFIHKKYNGISEEKSDRKELGKKKEVVKEKEESPKDREIKKKPDEHKQRDKTQKKLSGKSGAHKEDKGKEKLNASPEKKYEEELKKKIEQKKAVVDFDGDKLKNAVRKQKASIPSKQNKVKNQELFESPNESEGMKITSYDSDDSESGQKGPSFEKKVSAYKRNDKLMKKSQHKRKRFKSDSDDDDNYIESVNEKHKIPKSSKASSKSKIKKQSPSDEEDSSDDMPRKIKKKSKRLKKLQLSDSDSEEVEFKPKLQKRRSKFYESDEENRANKSPIKNFLKPKMTNENMSASKVKKSPVKAKVISVADFFGSSSVQRTERKASKRKISGSCEDEFHDDDDFAATLELLDMQEAQVKKMKVETPEKHKTPKKKEANIQKSEDISECRIAGKLAIKMEKLETLKISPKKAEEALSPSRNTGGLNKKNVPMPIISPKKKIDIPETPEQKMQSPSENRSAYRAYLNREGPRALGSKEIPQGADNCLEGLTFVITGVLESIERDEAKSLVERYGGKVTGSLSGRTSYIVIGRDAGETKLKKAMSLKTKQIDEDGLFDLIRIKPAKKSKYLINAEKAEKETHTKKEEIKLSKSKMVSPLKTSKKSPQKGRSPRKSSPQKPVPSMSSDTVSSRSCPAKTKGSDDDNESLLWVDKYKPKSLKQIIGQNGEKSIAKKLLNWLKNWQSNRAANVKPPSNRFLGANDTGAGMKAALLSGPPGVGKTTTAHLVCQEVGFSLVEMNASDTRSKSCLQSEVMTLLQNSSLVDFCGNGKSITSGIKHCLIMDEVDGMAGNEDRGGVAELIHLIKTSKIPIICLCNDRQHPKIRSLANYCFDLRFQRPRVEQIKAAMMTLAFREGLKISPPALNEIIVAANQDIRQIIYNLSMLTSTAKNLSYDEAKSNSQKAKKDIKLSPFDVCRQVFVGNEETRKMTLDNKTDLFFHDYQLNPLFVQENYPYVHPYAGRASMSHHLSLLAYTAESICDGDLVDRIIRQQQNWGLLPLKAMYASVLPGEYMRGNVSHMVSFPRWLGKFSTRNKNEHILQELCSHMRLCISSDKRGFNLDYLPCLRQHLTKPLQEHDKDGVPEVIKLMDDYDIIKEDYDNMMEFTKWPNTVDYSKTLSSSTKAAFTRAYNKESHMTPYSTGILSKKHNRSAQVSANFFNEEDAADNQEEDDNTDNIEIDTMIKKKKPGKDKKTKSSSSRGKS